MTMKKFQTKSVNMEFLTLVDVYAPEEDVDRIMAHVCKVDPLAQGNKYDSNAYQSAPGIERYRPLAGAAAGAETDVRMRPGVVRITFELPDNQDVLEQVVETIFQVHSYQEPVIRVQQVLTSRSRGLDDKNNPHRWWNSTGDWKEGETSDR